MCAKAKFVQYRYSERGAPLYSGTPAPSSGLVIANFFVYYDFYNRLNISPKEIIITKIAYGNFCVPQLLTPNSSLIQRKAVTKAY